jgi:hypothetical protein
MDQRTVESLPMDYAFDMTGDTYTYYIQTCTQREREEHISIVTDL